MRKLPLILALCLLLAGLAFAARLFLDSPDGSAARVQQGRSIRIAYAWEPPFALRDEQGWVSGEAPEVARAVLARMGITDIRWVQRDFADLIPELRAGRFDMIASGQFVTPEREALVAFSQPSACVEPALLVRRGNPLGLYSLQDLAARNQARLALLSGAVEADEARQAGVPPERLFFFATVDLALRAMDQHLVDALALSGPSINYLAQQRPALERATPFRGARPISGCAAFAFRAGDSELRDRFDRELAAFIGSPEHLELIAPFGFSRNNLPSFHRE